MGWPFDKQDAPASNPEVKDAPKGEKSPAELIAESLGAALKPLTEKLDSYGARFDALESNTRKPQPKAEPTEITSVLDDENAAFSQRMTPIVLRQLELEARIVRSDIKAEYASAGYGDLWSQYESEITNVLDSSPILTSEGKPMRGDPQYIRNAVDMVMGRAARKAGMRFDGKSKGFFLESASGSDNGSHQPENDGLTEGQRKVFGRMKVPLDEAKKVMAKLKFVSA
jgi:hypothetical protein